MVNLRYYAFYKPYGVLSQFTDEDGNPGLKTLISLQQDVYPVGRLDLDSEGLLLLTNDKAINMELLSPKRKHWRSYLVQVEGEATDSHCHRLEQPMVLSIKGQKYRTLPARAKRIEAPELPERNPPIRFRASIPTSWIELQLIEGKNRQVRKMTANVGLPTLRLVRWRIGALGLDGMQPGELKELAPQEFRMALRDF
jgi:23S rRNA pseudouridine2457 synthase